MEHTQREQIIGQFLEGLKVEARPFLAQFLERHPTLMKPCGGCKETLPINQFATKVAAKGRLQSYCRGCTATLSSANYQQNTEKVKAASAVSKRRQININRKHAQKRLAACSCSVCGSKDNLQFHTPNLARFTPVHQAVNGGLSLESVDMAIDAANVICKPCDGRIQGQVLQESNRYRKEMEEQGISSESLVPKDAWKKYQGIRKPKKGIIEIHEMTISRIEQKAAESVASVLYTAQAKTLQDIRASAQVPGEKVRSFSTKAY